MKSRQLTFEELERMSLEELAELWDKGYLSDRTKDFVVTKVPFLKIVREYEIKNDDDPEKKLFL